MRLLDLGRADVTSLDPGDVFVGAATPAHGFSNPYYQQHVAFNCSDLDDSPAPASSDQSGQTQYVNAPVAV